METIHGYIDRIQFQNIENGFTVAQLYSSKLKGAISIVGAMPGVAPGHTVRCHGEWKQHLIFGRQFAVSDCQIEAPEDLVGIRKYLGSGLIKGIGPKYASRIIDYFGMETLNVIDQTPERLLEVEGIGKKRADMIAACWSEQRSIREVMIFLQKYSISPSYAQKIFRIYGNQSVKRVQENPYILSIEVSGIGFKTADAIASKLGMSKDAVQRIDAAIEYVLSELASDGHVCYPVSEFVVEVEKVLEMNGASIESRLALLKEEGRVELFELVSGGKKELFVWKKNLFLAETGIAREIQRLQRNVSALREVNLDRALEWVQKELRIALAPNQQIAVRAALTDKVHIITGGPGTGKSTITNAILHITGKLTKNIVLAAPTGRAAKRMTEITKKSASTIHSLLEYDFKQGKFKRNKQNPIECDLIIIDEASMIDTQLMNHLLKAIPDHARLILVGDINQLPSVGPGNVLRDILTSQTVSMTTLNEIFRQAAGSRIVTNAHLINKGSMPDVSNHKDSDFFFLEEIEAEDVLKQIVALVSQRLPRKYGFDPFKDIQVLAPMKRGVIGIENMNDVLQRTLNPSDDGIAWGGRKFCVGDKVMQIRNNYERNVFNGDIGRVIAIDRTEQKICIEIDGREISYGFSNLDELVLSYAVSIHKYQGSEGPCVVIPIHPSHYILLTRNILYTGVTRGKKLVVLVGTKKALTIAVHNDQVRKRHTGLQQALINSTHHPI